MLLLRFLENVLFLLLCILREGLLLLPLLYFLMEVLLFLLRGLGILLLLLLLLLLSFLRELLL